MNEKIDAWNVNFCCSYTMNCTNNLTLSLLDSCVHQPFPPRFQKVRARQILDQNGSFSNHHLSCQSAMQPFSYWIQIKLPAAGQWNSFPLHREREGEREREWVREEALKNLLMHCGPSFAHCEFAVEWRLFFCMLSTCNLKRKQKVYTAYSWQVANV